MGTRLRCAADDQIENPFSSLGDCFRVSGTGGERPVPAKSKVSFRFFAEFHAVFVYVEDPIQVRSACVHGRNSVIKPRQEFLWRGGRAHIKPPKPFED
jgi:hypothetical protein